MVEQETGQRGFLITGKEEFLEPYESGQELFKNSIDKLDKLNSNAYDIPTMTKNLASLEKLAQDSNSGVAVLRDFPQLTLFVRRRPPRADLLKTGEQHDRKLGGDLRSVGELRAHLIP